MGTIGSKSHFHYKICSFLLHWCLIRRVPIYIFDILRHLVTMIHTQEKPLDSNELEGGVKGEVGIGRLSGLSNKSECSQFG